MITAVEERFVIPVGFMGEVAIVYPSVGTNRDNGRRMRRATYEIPESGLLRATGESPGSWKRTTYFLRHGDGSLTPIETTWDITLEDTPENRADPAVGICPLRAGGSYTSSGCRFEYETFIVGTKASILDRDWRAERDFDNRMQESGCGGLEAR